MRKYQTMTQLYKATIQTNDITKNEAMQIIRELIHTLSYRDTKESYRAQREQATLDAINDILGLEE